jgi:hypothetical protein
MPKKPAMSDPTEPARHPVTGRFLAYDCERDCLEHCAGLCGADDWTNPEGAHRHWDDQPWGSP